MSRNIRVIVVDDSAVVRSVLSSELERYSDIEVVATALDPFVARDKIIRLKPDVITLDIEMPRMNGLVFLKKLMKFYPLPVVIVSSLTPKNSVTALEALKLGAVEVICKPDSPHNAAAVSQQVARAIRAAASADIAKHKPAPEEIQRPVLSAKARIGAGRHLLAIGASTGGTEAIETVLKGLPEDGPATVIVQHMPAFFTAAFAERLNKSVKIEVREAKDKDIVEQGVALLAPGDKHLVIESQGSGFRVRVKTGPRVHYQRPSVDVLFDSVARVAGNRAIGVLLTGMGSDGADGLVKIKEQRGSTLAQDEKSCVVYGMPQAAFVQGAVDTGTPLDKMSHAILKLLNNNKAKK